MPPALVWVDEKFPFPLETSEQNYWLGFLMGDGCVGKLAENRYVLKLSLAVKDAYIVSRFAKFIGKKARSRKRYVECDIGCTGELEKLARHGLIPNKTGKEIYPESVTNHGSFIRGFIDADGSFTVCKKHLVFQIVKSEGILKSVRSKLVEEIRLFSNISPRPEFNSFRLSKWLRKQDAQKLYNFLYTGDPREPKLLRKERILKLFAEGIRA